MVGEIEAESSGSLWDGSPSFRAEVEIGKGCEDKKDRKYGEDRKRGDFFPYFRRFSPLFGP